MLNNCKTLETFVVLKVSLAIFALHMKDKIIHKASEMFITLGFKSVTMDDIANELAISKKTIYTHFKNKTELVHEVTMNMFELISHGIDCICDLQKNPIEELYEIKKLVMVHLKNEKTSPQYQLQKYYPEIHEALKAQHYKKMSECTLRNLKRGVTMGLYRENLDIDFVSRIYFIGVNGIKDEALFPVHQFPKIQLFEDYLEYHLRGIVTNEGLKTLNKFIKTTVHNA
jgi:AcrR family transcriptional regulator